MSQVLQRLPERVVTDAVSEDPDDILSGDFVSLSSGRSFSSQPNLPARELMTLAGSLHSLHTAAERGETGAQGGLTGAQAGLTGAQGARSKKQSKVTKKKNKLKERLSSMQKSIAKATSRNELPSVSANAQVTPSRIPDAAAAASPSPEHPRRQADSSGAASGGSMTGVKGLPSQLVTNGYVVMKPELLQLNDLDRHTPGQVGYHRHDSNRAYSGQVLQSSNFELQEHPGIPGPYAANGSSSFNSLDSLPSKHSSPSDPESFAEFTGVGGKKFRVYYSDVAINEDEIPVYLKEQYDIALLYADDDKEDALGFKIFLERFCWSNEGDPPRVCTIDYNPDMVDGSKIQHLEDAMKVSTYIFLFITKTFCNDNWATLTKDECLMQSLTNPQKRWCIVPVLTQNKNEKDITKAYKIPFGLTSLKPVDISHITLGQSLKHLMRDDPEEGFGEILTESTIMRRDKFFLNFFRNMMSKKQPVRVTREKQVREEKARFIADQKKQQAYARARQMAEEHAKKVAWEKTKKEKEEELSLRFHSGELADLPEPKPDQYGNYISRGPQQQLKTVDGGTTYIYNFHGDINGTALPPMPSGTHNEIKVEHAGIMQVGDYNTATTLTQDEEQDLYIPNRDVPQKRYLNRDSDDEVSPWDNSPPACANMDEAKSLPRPQNLDLGEGDSINLQLNSHQAVSFAKQAPEIQLQFELEEQLSHSYQPRDVQHMQQTWQSYGSHHQMSAAQAPQAMSEPSCRSPSGCSEASLDLYSATGQIDSTAVPEIRTRHFSAARGSPTENESSEDLHGLSVCEDRSGASSPMVGGNTAEDDPHRPFLGTSNQDLLSKSRLLARVDSCTSVTSDVPSLSERRVEGCEDEASIALVTPAGMAATQVAMATTQPSLPDIDLPDSVSLEKKEAQCKFAKDYFKDLCESKQAPDDSEATASIAKTDASANVEASTKTNSSASVAKADAFASVAKADAFASVAKADAFASVAKAGSVVTADNATLAPAPVIAMRDMRDTSSFDYTRQWAPASPTFPYMPGQLDSRDVLPEAEAESIDLRELQRFLDDQRQDLETPRGPLSQDYLQRAASASCEEVSSVNTAGLMEYLRQQQEDMRRPRAIEQFPVSLPSDVGMDGDEARRRYQAWLLLQAAFPHHVNPQWVMGRPMTQSVPSLPSLDDEHDDGDDVD